MLGKSHLFDLFLISRGMVIAASIIYGDRHKVYMHAYPDQNNIVFLSHHLPVYYQL